LTCRIKASIVEEYKRRRELSDAELAHSKGKSKEALDKRRQRNRESKGDFSGDEGAKGENSSSSVAAIYRSGREIEDIVDAFMEEPLVVEGKKGSSKHYHKKRKSSLDNDAADDGSSSGGSSVVRVFANDSAASKWLSERDRNADRKNEIKSSHDRHHNELVRTCVETYCLRVTL
jgi:hypothetical protein